MNRARRERELAGRRGEWLAAWYLRLLGWRILAERIRTPRGEIDLVARRRRTVAFVEVKWREKARDLDLAIDDWRMRRVVACVEACAHHYVRPGDDTRIDVLLLAPWNFPRHITNAIMT